MTLEILKRGNHLGRRMNFKGQFSSYTSRKSILRLLLNDKDLTISATLNSEITVNEIMEPYVASDCLLTKYARGPRLFTLYYSREFRMHDKPVTDRRRGPHRVISPIGLGRTDWGSNYTVRL